jgi:hypothetical protein
MTGFEMMAYNDCAFIGGPYWQNKVAPWLRHACNASIPSSYIISGIAGFLILFNKENRVNYPLKFIGLICLAQAANIYTLNSFDQNFCDSPSGKMLENTLVIPGSWTSEKLFQGAHLFNFSKLDITGMLGIWYVVFYHFSLFSEMLLSLCLNFDVVATIRQPFNRVENLKSILVFMQVGFLAILILCCFALAHCQTVSST